MSFAGGATRLGITPIPPPPVFSGSLANFSNALGGAPGPTPREPAITPPNTSSGANPDVVSQSAHNRLTMGSPTEPTPPPQFTSPTGQKVNLGQ